MADLLSIFQAERGRLFALAYRMLGSAASADDVLQDAYLRASQRPLASIDSPPAFLTTVVTRLCLDERQSAAAKRESYEGPWLDEPLLATTYAEPPSAPDRIGLAESLSLAFLTLLDQLTPLERAVFLLHEVFDHPFAEVAQMVEREEAACRQCFHRAQQHLAAGRPRVEVSAAERDRLVEQFLRACLLGDVATLEQTLADDVVFISDGGGKVSAARLPVRGRAAVARFVSGVLRKAAAPGAIYEPRVVNGQPGVATLLDGRLIGVLAIEVGPTGVAGLRAILNPDKLARVKLG